MFVICMALCLSTALRAESSETQEIAKRQHESGGGFFIGGWQHPS